MRTSNKNKAMIGLDLKAVVEHNEKQMELADYDQGSAVNLVTVEIDGQEIYNPFMDESGRFEVKPVGYYGKANMEKMLQKYNDMKRGK